VYGHTFIGTRVPLKHKPSDYFRERVWISCDPDERSIPALAERFGASRFLWASDFPHADHTPEYINDLRELALGFGEDARRQFLGDNARALFRITA
jgi:predicted TIM-barrel fold metal-dependent hydrolase